MKGKSGKGNLDSRKKKKGVNTRGERGRAMGVRAWVGTEKVGSTMWVFEERRWGEGGGQVFRRKRECGGQWGVGGREKGKSSGRKNWTNSAYGEFTGSIGFSIFHGEKWWDGLHKEAGPFNTSGRGECGPRDQERIASR